MRRTVAIAVVAVVGSLVVPQLGGMSVAGATSVAGPGTNLPCQTIGQMVVDPTTSQVFVSCPSSNSVAVLDSSGNLLATIGDIAGASGLAAVGNTVYVTAENTGTVDAINTSTLAANPLGATGLVDATDLVYAGGYLWSTTSDGDQALDEPLYRIDPSSGAVTIYNSLLGAFVDSLLADPGNPNEFLASTSDITFPSAQDITVSSGTPSAGPLVTLFNDGNPLAISPDGSTVFAQDSSNLVGLDSDTLQPNGVQYPAMYLINAVAASSGDGGVIAITNAGISIYRLGNPADMIGSTEWDDNQIVEPDGLAFSPDGMTIFAVTTAPYPPGDNGPPGPAEFHALTTNALPSPPPLINSPPYSENFGSVAVGTVSSQSVILQIRDQVQIRLPELISRVQTPTTSLPIRLAVVQAQAVWSPWPREPPAPSRSTSVPARRAPEVPH